MVLARRARVPGPVKAVADVTRKTHRPNRRTRAAENPVAGAERVAGRAAAKAAAKAGESGLNATLTILRFN